MAEPTFFSRGVVALAVMALPMLPGTVSAQAPGGPADTGTSTSTVADTTRPLLAACPIDGEHELVDSWGWRRSGGRRHQGIDISAATGTELYAVRDGVIDVKRSRLGGNAIWLSTDDGAEFYYAHLDRFEGDDRRVEAGELIGYVGSTGNAGGPHLHFEAHPSGAAENPFDHVVAACTAPPRATPGGLADDAVDADGSGGEFVSAITAFVEELRSRAVRSLGGLVR